MNPSSSPTYKPILKYMIIALVILGVVFKFIAASPSWIHLDENFYINIAQNYVDRGELTPYMWRLGAHTNIIAGSGSGYGILVLNEWLKLVGITLWNGRLLMIAAGFVTAIIMYFVGRKWWGSREAGIATFLFAIVATSPFYSLVMRMDSLGMLMYSIVLLLHIYAVRDNRRWMHFAAGVIIVVAAEFHILSIIYIIILTLYYLNAYVHEVIQRRRIVLNTGAVYFAVGGFIAGVIYIAVHILPDPQNYFMISSKCFSCENQEFMRIARFMLLRPIEFVLIFLIVISAARRRQPEDRHFLLLYVGWLVMELALGIPPRTHYSYHSWPLLAIGTAGLFVRGMQPQGILTRPHMIAGLVLAFVALFFNFGMHLVGFHPSEDAYSTQPQAALEYVNEVVPKDTVVMADVMWFYGLRDFRNFISYRDGDEYGIAKRGETQPEFWRRWQPQVFVGNFRTVDAELDQYMTEFGFEEVMPSLWMSAQLIAQIDSADHA